MDNEINTLLETQIRLLLKKHGYPLYIKTPYCDAFLRDNNNQCGHLCESYEGCQKGVKLLHLLTLIVLFPPKDIKEAVEASDFLREKIAQILSEEEKKDD